MDSFDVLGGAGVNPGFLDNCDFEVWVDCFNETVDCRYWRSVGLLAVVACIENLDLLLCAKVLVEWPLRIPTRNEPLLVKFLI